MPKQIIIAEQHRIAAVFSEDQIQELVVATGSHQVGDIYLGVVENVLPGIDAAFVNIGDAERNGFIHVTDLGPLRLRRSAGAITELLTPQQKVLVQVMKEPTGTKGPRLTGNITLPGRYLVLMPYGRGVNLSRRIRSENERNRLRALAILVKPPGMGLLVRTEAEGMAEEAVMEDLETLQKHRLEEEKRQKLLQTSLQETLRLDTLINNILISSQLEGNAYRFSKDELDLSDLTKDVVKAFETRYPDRTLTVNIHEDIDFSGDAMLLKLLLSNLLENANKYSAKNKPVSLNLSQKDAKIFLEVIDEGEGIPEEERKAVFEKFYRIGNEQTRKTKGTGLGLYICQKIVKDHGGDITIKDNRPSGTKFIVQFNR